MKNHSNNDSCLPIGLPPRKRAGNVRQALLAATMLAATFGLCSFSGPASAVTITNDDLSTVPGVSFNPTPTTSADFHVLTASFTNFDTSPFSATPQNGLPYSAVQSGGNAAYNLSGTSLSLFWGSPDAFNTITFYAGPGETGGPVGTFTGSSLLAFGATLGSGHDLVTFAGSFGSVLFTSSDQALEYTFAANPVGSTPLPAALPLYAAGVGVMGLLGWRRKRKQNAAVPA
jgi:hypothetical protein